MKKMLMFMALLGNTALFAQTQSPAQEQRRTTIRDPRMAGTAILVPSAQPQLRDYSKPMVAPTLNQGPYANPAFMLMRNTPSTLSNGYLMSGQTNVIGFSLPAASQPSTVPSYGLPAVPALGIPALPINPQTIPSVINPVLPIVTPVVTPIVTPIITPVLPIVTPIITPILPDPKNPILPPIIPPVTTPVLPILPPIKIK
ncbi:MAG: hypothetical protein REI78_15350 [Pedobacter sp.]|nr:hypothetical protein [Pedobacter sp.]MDQ8054407.1 hypothetical protein [Pedobacter sp.]